MSSAFAIVSGLVPVWWTPDALDLGEEVSDAEATEVRRGVQARGRPVSRGDRAAVAGICLFTGAGIWVFFYTPSSASSTASPGLTPSALPTPSATPSAGAGSTRRTAPTRCTCAGLLRHHQPRPTCYGALRRRGLRPATGNNDVCGDVVHAVFERSVAMISRSQDSQMNGVQ
jgi:hypothetical protein